ncbi:MAG: hypothetical protein AAGE92_03190 [Cyanobacteria bacterium P01_G01_bin.4]
MMNPQSRPRKVAVIAVHGVSDQAKEESAEAIAQLLYKRYAGDPISGAAPHSRAVSSSAAIPKHTLSIPVAPVDVRAPQAVDESCPNDDQQAWFDFMQERLVDYQGGQETSYETVRFSVCDRNSDQQRDIHVYEMYWADLSRLGNGIIRFFGSFFQLLFHLSTLGAKTLQLAWHELHHTKPLNPALKLAFQPLMGLHQAANFLLTLLIPTLVLGLFSGSLLSLPRLLPEDVLGLLDSAAIFVALFAGVYWIAKTMFGNDTQASEGNSDDDEVHPESRPNSNSSSSSSRPRYTFTLQQKIGFLSFLGLPFIALATLYLVSIIGHYKLAAFFWQGILVALAHIAFLKPYQKRDDRLVFHWPSWVLLGFMGISVWFLANQDNSVFGITTASFHQVEFCVFCLAIAWIAFNTLHFVFAIFSAITIALLTVIPPQCSQLTSRLNRSVWTGLVSLSAPSAIFFIVNAMLWSALVLGVAERLLIHAAYQPIIFTHADRFLAMSTLSDGATASTSVELTFINFAQILLKMTATSGFLVVLLLMGGVAIGAIWAFLPSIGYEAYPNQQQTVDSKREHPIQPTHNAAVASERLGDWLTSGLKSIAWLALLLLTLSMAFIFTWACYQGMLDALFPDTTHSVPVLSNFEHFVTRLLPGWLKETDTTTERVLTEQVLFLISTLTVGSISLLLALGNRAQPVLALFHSVLDAILDVDNHLRLHPKDCNPRAQISARYVSLLRFIAQQNYDKVVIIAHSQGTVISADLMRYLRCVPDPKLKTLPEIAFFTMGSPLRQLYSFGFPHLYQWIGPVGEQLKGTAILASAKPNPADLFQVKQWVNVFGSGDYIGRDLWRTDTFQPQWKPGEVYSGPMRKEYCLGAGAHTHYWDGTFPEVVEELDALIGGGTA